MTEDMILSGNWHLDESIGYVPNNAFGMAGLFFLPISGRLGMRFSF